MSITLTKETSLFKKDVIKDGISGAAATATDYIDDVPNSSQTGMTLQPVSNNANNYIQLDSDGLAVYKSGNLIASYGQSILLYHPGVSPLNAAVEITNSSARFTGQIQADSGYIGGWSIGADTNQSLHNGAANVSPVPGEGKIILSTGVPGTIATGNLPILPNGKAWAFTAGNQFGVTTDGDLYASAAHLEGLSVGNYSDATTNHLYGNCVWSQPFAAYFNTDLGNTRRTYQGWTIEQNTGEYFDFDTTNNWLVVDYSDYADKATTKILQQNTGIVAPNTNFTISADLGTDCKVVFGGIEISGTDWQTADDGRKYATFTTTANTTSGVFEIWPVASENYIFKGNKFKLEKSDSYSSWSTLDEQIGKTGNAISQSAEATASYFLNFTSADGLKISNNADPSTTTTDYIQITSSGVKTVYDSTHFSNLTSDGFRIYSGDNTYPVASFITDTTNNNASSVNFYKNGTNIPLVTINQNGATFNGDGTIGASGGIKLSTTNFTYSGSIGGSAEGLTNWRFTIGNQFGITADGTLYANTAHISGEIKATSGTIGAANATNKIQIGTNSTNASIYYGMSSLNSTSNGFYIGADGISVGGGKFKVTNTGTITATGLTISGYATSAELSAVSTTASNAAYTALSYITTITGRNGICVHNSGDTSNYANLHSSGMDVYVNGSKKASFGSTIVLGDEYGSHIEIDGSAFSIFNHNNIKINSITSDDAFTFIYPRIKTTADQTCYLRLFQTNCFCNGPFSANGPIVGTTTSTQITAFYSGWEAYDSNSYVYVRKNGKTVNLCGALKNTEVKTLNATPVKVFSIDYDYYPSQLITVLCQGSNKNIFTMRVQTNGDVQFERYRSGSDDYSSITTGSWFPFNITWVKA